MGKDTILAPVGFETITGEDPADWPERILLGCRRTG